MGTKARRVNEKQRTSKPVATDAGLHLRMVVSLWNSLSDDHKRHEIRLHEIDDPEQYVPRMISTIARSTRSPIEALFMCSLICVRDQNIVFISEKAEGDLKEILVHHSSDWPTILWTTQLRIGKFFSDFALFGVEHGVIKKVVVECDGHEFHEKTKQQIALDKARERFIASSEYYIMRFSGHEIYKDPDGCAREVLSMFPDTIRRDGDIRKHIGTNGTMPYGVFAPMPMGFYSFLSPLQRCNCCYGKTSSFKDEKRSHLYLNGEGPLCFVCYAKKRTGMSKFHRKFMKRFINSWHERNGMAKWRFDRKDEREIAAHCYPALTQPPARRAMSSAT